MWAVPSPEGPQPGPGSAAGEWVLAGSVQGMRQRVTAGALAVPVPGEPGISYGIFIGAGSSGECQQWVPGSCSMTTLLQQGAASAQWVLLGGGMCLAVLCPDTHLCLATDVGSQHCCLPSLALVLEGRGSCQAPHARSDGLGLTGAAAHHVCEGRGHGGGTDPPPLLVVVYAWASAQGWHGAEGVKESNQGPDHCLPSMSWQMVVQALPLCWHSFPGMARTCLKHCTGTTLASWHHEAGGAGEGCWGMSAVTDACGSVGRVPAPGRYPRGRAGSMGQW